MTKFRTLLEKGGASKSIINSALDRCNLAEILGPPRSPVPYHPFDSPCSSFTVIPKSLHPLFFVVDLLQLRLLWHLSALPTLRRRSRSALLCRVLGILVIIPAFYFLIVVFKVAGLNLIFICGFDLIVVGFFGLSGLAGLLLGR